MRMTLEQRHAYQAALRARNDKDAALRSVVDSLIDQRRDELAAHIAANPNADPMAFAASVDPSLARYRSAIASFQAGTPTTEALALSKAAPAATVSQTQSTPTTPGNPSTAEKAASVDRLLDEHRRLSAQLNERNPTPTAPARASTPAPAAATSSRPLYGLNLALQNTPDHEATARAEWAENKGGVRSEFSSEGNYVAFRKAELSDHRPRVGFTGMKSTFAESEPAAAH